MKATTFLTTLLYIGARAQCGPNRDQPYPPGSTTCPPPPTGGGAAPAGGGGGTTTTAAACTSPPCAASLLGDVGLTTATGTDSRSGKTFAAGENIYGPFEAGFASQQDSILAGLGCNPGSLGHVAGGIDTWTAEQMVAHQCSVTLPRVEGNSYVSLIDECGGHTQAYHFHERLKCLYDEAAAGHSTKVGEAVDSAKTPIYSKYESTNVLPELDACGGEHHDSPHFNASSARRPQIRRFSPTLRLTTV